MLQNDPPSGAADRLIALQMVMDETATAAAFLERAVALRQMGEHAAARRDARQACLTDPADPQALALCCSLHAGPDSTAETHDLAVALLESPFASQAERSLAVQTLLPERLPLVLHRLFPLTLRLTVVQGPRAAVTLEGTRSDDLVTPLGKGDANGAVAVDCHLKRPDRGLRQLRWHSRIVGAAPPIQGGAHRPDEEGRTGTAITIPATAAMPAPVAVAHRAQAPLWIIMPLKDGGRVLAQSLRSVLGDLRRLPGARLILVDDGSERAETRTLLANAARDVGVTVSRTAGGLGFTGAVNHGLALVGRGPVLLVNSDIWLPPCSLQRMLGHLRDPDVGTVTPLSNNAGSVCLLGPGRAAAMPAPAICDRLAENAWRQNRGLAVDLPNGNGFAMLISEDCLRDTGPLSGLYESGYYEEVDFCLRATMRGWRHVAAADCFVGHVGSVTYGAARHRLAAANHRRLLQRFPHYAALYARFAALDPLAVPRGRVLAVPDADWQPDMLPQTHPQAEAAEITWPAAGPILLPLRGPVPEALRRHPPERLRLVEEARLRAAGLRIDTGHDLCAAFRPKAGQLLIRATGTGERLAAFDCNNARDGDLADLAASLNSILRAREGACATGGLAHVIPVAG